VCVVYWLAVREGGLCVPPKKKIVIFSVSECVLLKRLLIKSIKIEVFLD
jgi:hypothetical protein